MVTNVSQNYCEKNQKIVIIFAKLLSLERRGWRFEKAPFVISRLDSKNAKVAIKYENIVDIKKISKISAYW